VRGAGAGPEPLPENAVLASWLRRAAAVCDPTPEGQRSAQQFERAATCVSKLRLPLREPSQARALQEVPGIGARSVRVVAEVLMSGREAGVEAAEAQRAPQRALERVWGVGPAHAARLWSSMCAVEAGRWMGRDTPVALREALQACGADPLAKLRLLRARHHPAGELDPAQALGLE